MAQSKTMLRYRDETDRTFLRKGSHALSKLAVLGSRSVLLPMSLRARFLRLLGMKIGKGCRIRHGVLLGSRHIVIGEDVGINIGTYIDGSGRVTIGDRVAIGPHVKIITGSHEIGPPEMRRYGNATKPVRIEAGAWLHAGCIILPGVTVARGCVIGAGAVVTKSTEPNGLYVGVPAYRKKDLPLTGGDDHYL